MDFHRLVVGNLCMDSVRHLQTVPCAVRKEDQNSQQGQDCCCVPKLRQQMGCEIMGLFDSFKKKRPAPKAAVRTNSRGEDLNRLTEDGELPFGWLVYNQEIISQMASEFAPFRKAIQDAETPLEEYAALKSYMQFLIDGKQHYEKIGECEGRYFYEFYCDCCETKSNFEKLKRLEKALKK